MKCENCNINPASVHLTTIKDGHKIEMNLCEQCAKEGNSLYFNSNISFQDFLKGLLDMTMNSTADKENTQSQQKENNITPNIIEERKCPMCNMAYKEFRKTGKFGCVACYKTFETNLDTIFKRIHGDINHTGKIPKRAEGQLRIKREIQQLKNQLKQAVEQEEYELAATLRDKIREFQKEGY